MTVELVSLSYSFVIPMTTKVTMQHIFEEFVEKNKKEFISFSEVFKHRGLKK